MLKALSGYFQGVKTKYSRNRRHLRQMEPLIQDINNLEPLMMRKTDEELRLQTQIFKDRFIQGETLDVLLPEAFATVREASRRTLKMRHFDVQLLGGITLHKGMIAEMKTGEGKTLVATLPVYLNALTGKGVHLVTVNDYLAKRDLRHMGAIYEFLGLTTGCIVQDLTHSERKAAYNADITYATNNELGFDYLRDNMKVHRDALVQRPFAYAIVDEVDSILIDEARTPLIISGPAEDASTLYTQVNEIILRLEDGDYEKEEKHKNISFTDAGCEKVEILTKNAGLMEGNELFQPENLMLVHHLNQALKAQKMFHKDVDYIIKDGQVVLIDEFTGRMMKGRRYSDGLHQALEAKEGVDIELENQTVASITFQNFFRIYPKLAGMTGTASTEKSEFEEIYKLPVVSIPTNTPICRVDHDDEIFRTFEQKKHAIVHQIRLCYERRQPVLVGTSSIEKSEIFAQALTQENLPFNVLNARHHEREAGIISDAGLPGAVTIATNMAGRGTDIKLGGNLEGRLALALDGVEDPEEFHSITEAVKKKWEQDAQEARNAGGLYVLGTERHESRRIDNQLRGRSGRQGDPGESKFFISLEDDLMRIFGPNIQMINASLERKELAEKAENLRLSKDMPKVNNSKKTLNSAKTSKEKEHTSPSLTSTQHFLGDTYEPIQHPWLTRAIEKAQKRVEAQHFETRKHLLKYAEVLNTQRKAVYKERYKLLDSHQEVPLEGLVRDAVGDLFRHYRTHQGVLDENQNRNILYDGLRRIFSFDSYTEDSEDSFNIEEKENSYTALLLQKLAHIREALGEETVQEFSKSQFLKLLDHSWTTHLNVMEHVRNSIHLQAYGQKDPLNEYKREAFLLFQNMIVRWHQSFLSVLFHLNLEETESIRQWVAYSQHQSLMEDEENQSLYKEHHSEGEEEGEMVFSNELLEQFSNSPEAQKLMAQLENAPEEEVEAYIEKWLESVGISIPKEGDAAETSGLKLRNAQPTQLALNEEFNMALSNVTAGFVDAQDLEKGEKRPKRSKEGSSFADKRKKEKAREDSSKTAKNKGNEKNSPQRREKKKAHTLGGLDTKTSGKRVISVGILTTKGVKKAAYRKKNAEKLRPVGVKFSSQNLDDKRSSRAAAGEEKRSVDRKPRGPFKPQRDFVTRDRKGGEFTTRDVKYKNAQGREGKNFKNGDAKAGNISTETVLAHRVKRSFASVPKVSAVGTFPPPSFKRRVKTAIRSGDSIKTGGVKKPFTSSQGRGNTTRARPSQGGAAMGRRTFKKNPGRGLPKKTFS